MFEIKLNELNLCIQYPVRPSSITVDLNPSEYIESTKNIIQTGFP